LAKKPKRLPRDLRIIRLLVILTVIIGAPFIIVFLYSIPLDLYIDPEYVSGILTASSIVFGIWALNVGLFKRETSSNRWLSRLPAFNLRLVIWNLWFFGMGVVFLFLSILSIMPTLITVCWIVSGFILNCGLLVGALQSIRSELYDSAKKSEKKLKNQANTRISNTNKTPLELLKTRYVKGKISREEYEEIKETIEKE
jgi:Na+-transporting methylmalonyl-CoA/oxaloacetate decarboxylase gamma subunit